MAKKIIMIAPFDVLTGNLSGQQSLQYAENNNPAYEAPNGSQGARNYKTRYVGARRADGTTYFSVRQKNTAVLNGKTRMAMGLTAVTALIISACKKAQASASYSWAKIKVAYEADRTNGTLPEGVDSVTKFANYYIRRMLQYKQAKWFRQSASSPVELFNPYDLGTASALVINSQKWLKFADLFVFDSQAANVTGAFYFLIDGVRFVCPITAAGKDWSDISSSAASNLNWKATLTGIVVTTDPDSVTYLGQPVYTDTRAVTSEDVVEPIKYTTIAPEP